MNLTVGQKVKVYGRYHYPTSVETGEVIKVGRKLATIKVFTSEDQYRMDTGRDNGHGNSWFKTLEQAEADGRIEEARRFLGQEARVTIHGASPLTNPQVEELAAIVKQMLSEKPADYASEIKDRY